MLTQEQIIKYRDYIDNADSVFELKEEIEIDLRRKLTDEELSQILNYETNGGFEAQFEQIRRISTDTTAAPVDKTVRIKQLANDLANTYCRKNADYGDSFGISVHKYGIIAALTRMSDKWNRLENLILNMDKNSVPNVSDESVLDTLLDMATYALMTYMEIEKGE